MSNVPSLVSASVQLLTTLRTLDAAVVEQWPSSELDSPTIVVQEIGNNHTSVPVVDDLSYQVDVWTEDADATRSLFAQADELITQTGFHRTMLSPLSVDGFGWRQSGRYGRRVDKRTLRLID